jgi:hypothetical protein
LIASAERKGAMNKVRPSDSSLFLVGKDSRGNWVARNPSGLRGGLFVSRAEALKFAMSENGKRPQAVITVPGVLELDMSAKSGAGRFPADAQARLRRVA